MADIYILLVESDKAIREEMARTLIGRGFQVIATCNGDEAFNKLKAVAFQGLILNRRESHVDCFELARQAKRIQPNIRVILKTDDQKDLQGNIDGLLRGSSSTSLIKAVVAHIITRPQPA